jgi:hypothetical protein
VVDFQIRPGGSNHHHVAISALIRGGVSVLSSRNVVLLELPLLEQIISLIWNEEKKRAATLLYLAELQDTLILHGMMGHAYMVFMLMCDCPSRPADAKALLQLG